MYVLLIGITWAVDLPIAFHDVGPVFEGCGYNVTIGEHHFSANISLSEKKSRFEK